MNHKVGHGDQYIGLCVSQSAHYMVWRLLSSWKTILAYNICNPEVFGRRSTGCLLVKGRNRPTKKWHNMIKN